MTKMRTFLLVGTCWMLLALSLEALSFASKSTTRRAFLGSSAAVASVVATQRVSNAYERRDVGGEGRSPEGAAMNEQAYQTNNRLEKQGLKLETQEEQKATLSAALSDYSYTSSTSTKKGEKKGASKK